MITVRVECIGVGCAPQEGFILLNLPENAAAHDVLNALDLREEEVMMAFINGEQATLSSPLHDDDLLSLCAYMCGG